ncbi:hypothetical protein M409DRAFT_70657 [Zasmidium cellare ATCC 36951]|uniref:RING-type domain-containing protein n=1 Tax=Zasmidium cellare ATCC 36951 TaxID=1080233 RepID=A0A6A6C1U5_ZASCE|nr:uncharacterized protein M409DRAFT_70657 [Zasmidium cellare ATCC 36951]KAF2160130.1 hypothetical protein M409DRAFT_70657 [Zasmidium cellare ATCC 36951]
MDNEHAWRCRRGSQPLAQRPSAINAKYTASSEEKGILVRDISNSQYRALWTPFSVRKSHHERVLAFHPTRLNLLAASNGSQLVILDIEASTTICVFNGNGRTITSISFGRDDGGAVATGSADGTICVWSMNDTSRPIYRLRAFRSACSHLSLGLGSAGLISAISGSNLCMWKLPSSRPIASIKVKPATLQLFTWSLETANHILTLSHGGILSFYDLEAAIGGSPARKGQAMNMDSDEEDGSHTLSNTTETVSPYTTFNLECSIAQAEVLGQNGLVVLQKSRKDLYFYNYSLEHGTMTEIWRLHKDCAMDCFSLRRLAQSVDAAIVSDIAIETYKVPVPVLDSMGWSQSPVARLEEYQAMGPKTDYPRSGFMKPQKKVQRVRAPGRTTPNKPRLKGIKDTLGKAKSRNIHRDQGSRPGTPATNMTSSLELPKEHHIDDEDSPMPFLSPNIPARRVSPGLITPLDESMQLPPLALSDSIATVAEHAHESDSDDETFAGDMKGSGTLLPGGINVPLPRSCGAMFSPNGQLVTFFPYSIKKTVNENITLTKGSDGVEKHGEEVNKLFPSFGNLLSTAQSRYSSSASKDTSSEDLQAVAVPRFAVHSSSFDDAPSWAVKVSPTKSQMQPLPGDHRVNVSVRSFETLTPTRKSLANAYGSFDEVGLPSSEVCRSNAAHAAKVGLQTSAMAWRLLAIILDSSIVDPHLPRRFEDVPALFLGHRPAISRNASMASSREAPSMDPTADVIPLLSLPFGRTWAIERLFQWAEERVDVQLLACMSTLLPSTCETIAAHSKFCSRRRQTRSVRSNMPALTGSDQDSTMFPPDLPTLRTESIAVRTADSSPNKAYRSRLSSGNPSQPTTPYLDSSSSTPPFTFSNITTQNSRILTSGSASPEHQRSSFGAAAKNYAASIAEKFSSYGSSPPLKRLGTSPGNELSSSLPNATGSWSKSVSFASTMEPSRGSRRSLSLAQEDDNYDSDRTVDDNSVLHTPKKPHTGVSMMKKKGSFYGEATTTMPTQLVPEQLSMKSSFWRHRYAEHLRSWDMLTDAADMTNFSSTSVPQSLDSSHSEQSVVPETHSGRRFNDCSICYCVVQAAEQVCPACLHVTHPGCLEEFLSAVGPDSFTCPTGCGCDCTSATEMSFASEDTAIEEEAQHKQPFKKRPSLTDPLRLRQRLQGESW